MNPDRYLLERAAQAAGIEGEWHEGLGGLSYLSTPDQAAWSPLLDDGDALRLAARLTIDIDFQESISTVLAIAPGRRGVACSWADGGDRAAAVRLAITRAAVSVLDGK
jgi:hypothetical protein